MNPKLKNDWQIIIGIVVTVGITGFVMTGFWIITDPSQCHEKIQKDQNNCQELGWFFHIVLISLPVLVAVMVLRMFKEDPKESKQEQNHEEPSFDYSKMGASSEQPSRHGVEQ